MPLYKNQTNVMITPKTISFILSANVNKKKHMIYTTKMAVQSLLNAYLRSIVKERLGACFPYPLS